MTNPNHPAKPTKKINYRAEVRKVFPRARVIEGLPRAWFVQSSDAESCWTLTPFDGAPTIKDAWLWAYENMQQEMKR